MTEFMDVVALDKSDTEMTGFGPDGGIYLHPDSRANETTPIFAGLAREHNHGLGIAVGSPITVKWP